MPQFPRDIDALDGAVRPRRHRLLDADGDKLSYRWWQYTDAGTYPGSVAVTGGSTASFRVPADAVRGQTIHLIFEVTDDGAPALKHYQRVIVTVK
ncbi:hypothetical protein M1L60_08030 [Actinoplanes sp. TRM 88003]|uniref:Cellulose-binding Sde182 C-terminal domain-containing protein n=1 Tax=Paractinoplanes aksuensis TaxID=2939490 RepID=A0ABT1DIA3_9ACTN|nr:hypothetical protein [Actinoplanes aksuensis]MCO8270544.1 hypothetical protein [Actinoplanes aksuensis]